MSPKLTGHVYYYTLPSFLALVGAGSDSDLASRANSGGGNIGFFQGGRSKQTCLSRFSEHLFMVDLKDVWRCVKILRFSSSAYPLVGRTCSIVVAILPNIEVFKLFMSGMAGIRADLEPHGSIACMIGYVFHDCLNHNVIIEASIRRP